MRSLAALLGPLLLTLIPAAHADRAAEPAVVAPRPPPAAPPPAAPPPPALAVVHHIAAGDNTVDVGTVDFASKKFTARFAGLPIGQYAIATHPASGRWALGCSPVGGEALPVFGGLTPSPAPAAGVITLVLGDAAGVIAVLAGDPTCKAGPCFEKPAFFTPDGKRVVLRHDTSKGHYLTTLSFEEKPLRTTWIDRRKARLPAPDAFTVDLSRGVYERSGKGLFVDAIPALPADARGKPKAPAATKLAVTAPKLLMGAPLFLDGDQLAYFRREPVEQKQGFIEVYDLKAKATRVVHTFAHDFPMWFEGFHFAAASPTREVFFLDSPGANLPANLMAFSPAAGPARVVAGDLMGLWDVTPDGRWALVSRFTDPKRGDYADNPQQLAVVDTTTGKSISVVTGVPGARISAARFIKQQAPDVK